MKRDFTPSKGRLPDFIIIGALKAGTTSLYYYLRQHPGIFMPELKELRFFAFDCDNPDHRTKVPRVFPVTTEDEYKEHFAPAAPSQIAGEASPAYLNSPIAAKRIKALIPNARVVACLRNPIDAAYSLYQMNYRAGRVRTKPGEWEAEESDQTVQTCLYYQKLRRYYDVFPREQIKVVIFDDLVRDPSETMRDLYRFLGAGDFMPDVSASYNTGGIPRSRGLYRLYKNKAIRRILMPLLPRGLLARVRSLRNANLTRAPRLPPAMRTKLARFYETDVRGISELIGRDLYGPWIAGEVYGSKPSAVPTPPAPTSDRVKTLGRFSAALREVSRSRSSQDVVTPPIKTQLSGLGREEIKKRWKRMRNGRITVGINPQAWDRHTSQVHCGLVELAALGRLSLHYDRSIPLGPRSTMWAEINEARCFFDMRDGVGLATPEAAVCYFKRSFRQGTCPTNVYPYGLYYPCRPTAYRHLAIWRHPERAFRYRSRPEFEIDPLVPAEHKVLFLTRLWEPTSAHGRDEKTMHELNTMRAETIRTLKREFGERFIGGLADTPMARARYSDLISDTAKYTYMRALRRCVVGVTTTGLHESTGAKVAEYLAGSRCVVTEPILNALPEPLSEGRNILTFQTPDECTEACSRFLEDRNWIEEVRQANYEYYIRNVRPVAVVSRCLRIALNAADRHQIPIGASAGHAPMAADAAADMLRTPR